MKKRNLLCIVLIVLCMGAFVGYRMLDAMRTDTRAPEIVVPPGVLEASVKEPKSDLTRGLTAKDREDGDVTDSLVVESIGILSSDGTVSVTYAAFDAAGNVAKAQREVRFTDYHSPRFVLTEPLIYNYNSNFDILRTIGAEDVLDGDIQHRVRAMAMEESSISVAGMHQVQFQVTNTLGDTHTQIFPVEVLVANTYDAQLTLTDYLIYLPVGSAFNPNSYLGSYTYRGAYRNTKVNSLPHGQNALLPLTSLEIDLFNPQGTKIVLGSTQKTLSEVTNDRIQGAIDYTKESTDALAGKLSSTQQEVKSTLTNYQTEIEHTKETVGIMASKAYVEKSTFEEYKEETATEFAVNAEAVNMKFTRTTEQIRNLDNDLQAKLEKYARYFKFTLNGLVIGGGTNAITLSIDNEGGLVFSKNGIPFGWWDGVDFRTGNIVVAVNERAQFGNFAFVPRSSGSLSFLKVKGSNASGAQHTHSYTEAITKAATCTETGVKAYMCSCGHSYTETISATGHNYNEVVTPPTDTERGYTTHTCSNCGDKYVDSYIDPKAKAISIGVVYPEWGTVSVNGAEATNTVKQYYFNDGDTVTLTAYPNDAFSFWYDSNGAVKSYANPYTFVVGEDTADALYAT